MDSQAYIKDDNGGVEDYSASPKTAEPGLVESVASSEVRKEEALKPYVAKEQKESFGKRVYQGVKGAWKKTMLVTLGTATLGLAGFGAFSLYEKAHVSKASYDAIINDENQQTQLIKQQSEQIGRLERMIRQLAISMPASGNTRVGHENNSDNFDGSDRFGRSDKYDSWRNDWKPAADDSTPSYWLGNSNDAADYIVKEKEDYIFVVDKKSQTGFLYRLKASLVETTPVSTGKNPGDKNTNGDSKTPAGTFNVVSVEPSSDWVYDDKLAYGPYFLRLNSGNWDSRGNFLPNAKSPIGVHGTNEPEKLGLTESHGCVRVDSDKIRQYVEDGILKKGTKVVILGDEYSKKAIPVIASTNTAPEATAVVSLEKIVGNQKPLAKKSDAKISAGKKTYHLPGGELSPSYSLTDDKTKDNAVKSKLLYSSEAKANYSTKPITVQVKKKPVAPVANAAKTDEPKKIKLKGESAEKK